MSAALPTSEGAVIELLRRGEQPLRRYLLAHADTPAQADELTQETLVRAYCALQRGEQPRQPLAWLLGIARHVLLETWRGRRYERQLRDRLAQMMGTDWRSPWHDDWQDQVERRVIVGEALDGLPASQREPVLLHYYGGLPIGEVATHLALSVSAVKMRLLRARLALRAELEDFMSEPTTPSTVPAGTLAAQAARVADRPPLYDALSVCLHVGGERYAVAPMAEPVFSGAGLSLDDLQFAVERLQAVRLAADRPLAARLELCPLPDPFEHPQPAAVWSLLRSAEVGNGAFQAREESRLVPTDGWRLGTDPEGPQLLADIQHAGLRHVWFTFLGLADTHDALCHRPGAFAAIVTAMERCRVVGLATGANIIVSTRNTGEVAALAQLIRSLGGERFMPAYVPSWAPSSQAYEAIRPQPGDLVGLPPRGLDVNWGDKPFWDDPTACTERALIQAVIEAGEQPPTDEQDGAAPPERRLDLFVDDTLDVWLGVISAPPLHRIANLRDDPPERLRARLLAVEWPPAPPADAQLAASYGDRHSQQVYMSLAGLRCRWVDAWRSANDVPWLASY